MSGEERVRVHWMDLLRGGAVLLVVLLHVQDVAHQSSIPTPEALRVFNQFFAPFRMPTLMFLSGMLLPPSLAKGLRRYYSGKVRNIAWPYLVWCLLFLLLGEGVRPIWDPLAWVAAGYLWYIFFLLCYYLLAPLVSRVNAGTICIALLLISTPLADGLPKYFLFFAAFFFAGNGVARSG
ncbi:acyltransferase family protein, partial [Naasia sp.]|uniref:acyltransferase family protein n=1 Tax=Naasia sp. TaxID=2546198 RepID=UPI00263872CB